MAVSRARAGAGAVAVAVPAVAVLVGYMARHPSGRLPGRVTLAKAPESTVFDENGAVRSVQSAKLSMPEADLQRLWTPPNLENLGASYWHFLTRVTLGMVRVLYSDTDRRVTLFGRRFLTLLRFDAPEFEMEETRAKISWQIKDGLLVASNGRAEGGLALEVTRDEPDDEAAAQGTEGPRAELGIEVEVTNFYPAIASRLGDFIYRNTQAFIHVLVCNAFLRSLGHLELHESKIGRFPGGSRDAPGHSA
jgi:hypothetical protein